GRAARAGGSDFRRHSRPGAGGGAPARRASPHPAGRRLAGSRRMSAKSRRQLELGFAQRGGQRKAGTAAARERRAGTELDLGYARRRHLYELGKLLGSYDGEASVPAVLRCLGRSVPLRLAMLVEIGGGSARIQAVRGPGLSDAELETAAAHARACAAR